MKYREISENELKNIWTENYFRVFLSHKAKYKIQTSELKQELEKYGITAFVAHEDIEPTKEWQTEIEKALFSMDAFVALITEDFYNGDGEWTNQEIGFSIAFDIPHIYINLGGNPRGFAAKFQALSCSWKNAPKKIFNILFQESDKMKDVFINSLKNVDSYILANEFYSHLIELKLNNKQYCEVIAAYNGNNQISRCIKFNGNGAPERGIIPYLNKWSGKKYKLDIENNKIVEDSLNLQ